MCAGRITTHEITIGRNIGSPPSRHMRFCLGCVHVQNLRLGTICSVRIVDCRLASWLARYITMVSFSISDGWNWNPNTEIQRAALLVVWPVKYTTSVSSSDMPNNRLVKRLYVWLLMRCTTNMATVHSTSRKSCERRNSAVEDAERAL